MSFSTAADSFWGVAFGRTTVANVLRVMMNASVPSSPMTSYDTRVVCSSSRACTWSSDRTRERPGMSAASLVAARLDRLHGVLMRLLGGGQLGL